MSELPDVINVPITNTFTVRYIKERTCRPIAPIYTTLPGTDCPAWECSECGGLFEAGALFCSQCGARVVEQ